MPKKSINQWQFGDFQTPNELARKIVELLKRNHNMNPDVVIEPTCGKGAFVRASYEGFKQAKILGFEINQSHIQEAKRSFNVSSQTSRVTMRRPIFLIPTGTGSYQNIRGIFSLLVTPLG